MDWNGTKATLHLLAKEKLLLPAVALPPKLLLYLQIRSDSGVNTVEFLTGPIHFPQEEVTSQRLALRFCRFAKSQRSPQEIAVCRVQPCGVSPLVLMATLVAAASGMLWRKQGGKGGLQHEKSLCRLTPGSRNRNKGMILKRQLIHQPVSGMHKGLIYGILPRERAIGY